MKSHLVISESRNTVEGFAARTMHNLARASEMPGEFHMITLAANSLLGLIVFPFTRSSDPKATYSTFSLRDAVLSDLYARGWPRWRQSPACYMLENLIKNLRHAIAHGNVSFSDESRQLGAVELKFENYYRGRLQWSGRIYGDDLFEFSRKLAQYLINRVG